ncbi:Sjogren's syndrome/scleroderma autoantigen 1 family protein [Halorubrum sp. SP9]|uniref:Sjogren's syndrome/scleroderma autoantigen 1 family protein n=1 Tax=Halorubrum sp. SP9 TaxID=1537267 RepID=UPI0010F9A312|nr:Sjogren's syndrome/scleroderma autoantigen 1 family protein [Halorubrum sp. SP9]TKX71116.1 hypothetical protein EXE45_02525 [Halorubrum sp. SP9]
MSDGFDKEAEREKLREKFAEDEKKREHTQRMSELLLKGATMTNRHCEECGDPIFRHDGREFCPTCGNEVGGAAGAGDAVDAPDDATEARDAPDDATEARDAPGDATEAPDGATSTSADESVEGAVDAAAENGAVGSDAVDSDAVDSNSVGSRANGPARPQSPPSAAGSSGGSASPRERSPRGSEPQRSPPSQSADDEGIGAARASLTRTLTRFARAAEETDDPRRARDHLEAAREAAEALAALNR